MANITAAEVNKLRKMTGAGMMDCKQALQEANGNFEEAIDILRKKGQKVAAKRSDREASEGLVLAKVSDAGDRAALIMLNCETDFVAKNEDFGKVASTILDIALNSAPADLEGLKQLPFGNGLTIAEKITEEIGKIGEKIELSTYEVVLAGKVIAYNHPGNKLASVVGFTKATSDDIAKDVAMQVAAMAPVAVDEAGVPADVLSKELEIGKELAIQEGKPADMAEKIAQGRLKKFIKESTLLSQPFIKDNKLTIADYLKSSDNDLSVTEFKRAALN